MRFPRTLMIRRKLTLIMVLTSCVTLIVACVAWLSYDRTTYRETMISELSLMGEIVGDAAAAAVEFGFVEEVEDSLTVLVEHPQIRRATIFDAGGGFMTSYRVASDVTEAPPLGYRPSGHSFTSESLVVWTPIVTDGQRVGTLALESDFRELRRRQLDFLGILALVLAICLAVAFVVASRLQALISGPIMSLSETMRDVSERKDYSLRAEKSGGDEVAYLTDAFNEMLKAIQDRDAELEHHRDTLEEEVSQRTAELMDRNEQLRLSMEEARAAAVTKAQFLANMSHEIRTPMNGILGMNSLLLDSPLNDQQRSYADIVKNSAESLLEIINDILDFSKIEAGKLSLERVEFDFFQSIEEVVSLLASPAHEKDLDVVCWISPRIPPILRGDPTRVRQVITNLLGNAVKFTDRGHISVDVDFVEETEEDVSVRVSVRDTGIGIEERKRDRLFRSFSQVDASTTRKFGGTGLGLAICKQLVELMNGEIGVESERGVGSTFWFDLRLEKLPPGEELVREPLPSEAFVLVADRSRVVRDVLERLLTGWDLEHAVATDEESLRRLVREARGVAPRVLLIDEPTLAQGGSDLDAFLESERRDGLAVLVTRRSGRRPVAGPGRLEPEGRVSKPIRPSELHELLRRLAEHDRGAAPEIAGDELVRAVATPAAPMRILLAEDNPINQLVAKKILQKGGHDCVVVEDGDRALAEVQGGGYDLVLMDCQMPRMDGFEATQRIRAWEQESSRRTPVRIIALTANAMKGDRERCLEAGMDDYLSKPVEPAVLLHKVRAVQAETERHVEEPGAPLPQVDVGPDGVPRPVGPPFDAEDLLARFGGRREDLRAEIAKLDRRAVDCLGRIKYCLAARYADSVRTLVATLRQALALISSDRLHALAVDLGRLVRQGDFERANVCFERLQAEFALCRAYLPEVLARAEYE
jgi:signal transduction histidine kinase/CheY-like chemotaxis protein